jgi:hypothetical protein
MRVNAAKIAPVSFSTSSALSVATRERRCCSCMRTRYDMRRGVGVVREEDFHR